MEKRNEWERFFDGHAPVYMENVFTKNTVKEIDFVLKELKIPKGGLILDIGCGTGRHSIELAKRGYKVTGVDLSSGMLAQAKKFANESGVEVEWIKADATKFKSKRKFDATICLCEGAFSLIGKTDDPFEHDLAILRNIHSALKPKGGFILTTLNAMEKIRRSTQKDVKEGKFDPIYLTENQVMEWDSPKGKKSVQLKEKGYVSTELILFLGMTGFKVKNIWGGTAGNWGRRQIDLDEIEIMVIAEKRG
jgi:2-polyprenyl-3-methyl-5-hydroxy-6-metoxy-1,4-benzoquinol methylase